jgi:predicted NUDIX family NTP pyrophosphohydrolase
MPQRSAGLLLYRRSEGGIEVLLVHPGGPFWAKKDDGAWSIPKGTYEPDVEEGLAAAKREFAEETGTSADAAMTGEPVALGSFRQSSAKIVDVWAAEGDFDPAALRSNTFPMGCPPRSGRMIEVPEVDRAGWFAPEDAARKMLRGQRPALEALLVQVGNAKGSDGMGTD